MKEHSQSHLEGLILSGRAIRKEERHHCEMEGHPRKYFLKDRRGNSEVKEASRL